MGHYDDQYEEQYKRDKAAKLQEAKTIARKHHAKILKHSNFVLLGICGVCAREVYAIPNWGCPTSGGCPHKP